MFLKDWESLTWSPLPLDAGTSVGKTGEKTIKSIKLHFPEGPGLPPAQVAHWACPDSGSRLLWQGEGPPPRRPPACPGRTKVGHGQQEASRRQAKPCPSTAAGALPFACAADVHWAPEARWAPGRPAARSCPHGASLLLQERSKQVRKTVL